MKGPKLNDFRAGVFGTPGYRTEEQFKAAFRSGDLPWTEIHQYIEWRKAELKDCRIMLRISVADLMKLKALARMQGKKYQTYIGEILKREIHEQEDRMANAESDDGEAGMPA